MPKKKKSKVTTKSRYEIYSYEDLLKMSSEERLTIYNRTAERVNRRISRAAHQEAFFEQPEVKRPAVFRSKAGKERFTGSKAGEQAAAIVRLQNAPVKTVAEIRKEPDDFKTKLKQLIGMSYNGLKTDDAYKAEWIDELSPEELRYLYNRMKQLDIDPSSVDFTVWYRVKRALIAGHKMKPIRSYQDMRNMLTNLRREETKNGTLIFDPADPYKSGRYIGPLGDDENNKNAIQALMERL